MAASTESLHALHEKFSQQLADTLQRDIEDKMPTDAATLGVIKGFLKDNEITADPATRDMTSELQAKFKQQQDLAKQRKEALLSVVKSDIQQTG